MALYKYSKYLLSSSHNGFDGLHEPGTRALYPGIYRCAGCGREIATAAQHVLPPQTHHAHRLNEGKIRWQLVVSHS